MKAVEIFRVKIMFGRESTDKLREEAENLINDKHYQGYRLLHLQFEFADNSGYIYAFITMKTPNSY